MSEVPSFSEGSLVEVWAASKEDWFPGHVVKVFAADAKIEGHHVPAGTLLVKLVRGHMHVSTKNTLQDAGASQLSSPVQTSQTYRCGGRA